VTQSSNSGPGVVVRRIPDGLYTLVVELVRDRRLQKSVRWALKGETIQVRAPERLPAKQLESLIDDIVAQVLKQRTRARKQNDHDLETRAQAINKRYFDDALSWHTIRWVSNMTKRLGSCTEGGSTDGDIRISERIKPWPSYVVDYVIAHELAHRKYPNHSAAFWAYLTRYPHTERARGFIEGIAYAEGSDPDTMV